MCQGFFKFTDMDNEIISDPKHRSTQNALGVIASRYGLESELLTPSVTYNPPVCNWPGCTDHAIKEVVYVFPDASRSTPIARVCAIHSQCNCWNQFFNKDGWKLIVETFKEMGKRAPVQRLTIITTQPIGTSILNTPKRYGNKKELAKIKTHRVG